MHGDNRAFFSKRKRNPKRIFSLFRFAFLLPRLANPDSMIAGIP